MGFTLLSFPPLEIPHDEPFGKGSGPPDRVGYSGPCMDHPAGPATVLADRYQVERVLGRGGFGEVLQCRDLELGRAVAVKLLRAQVDAPESRARFEREARVTASLRHDHIVQVFDFGVDRAGRAFVVYDLLEGFDLERVVASAEEVSEATVVEWGTKIAGALAHAHQSGVIHRDVKPANVFLRGGAEPLLVDFGIAREDQGRTALTADGVLLGSPAYMAPELWRGRAPSPASDQFAWATSLYEVLYRHLPYPGASAAEIMAQALSGRRVEIPEGFRGRRPGLEAALLRALEADPEDRYRDLDAFGGALADGLRGSLGQVLASRGAIRRADFTPRLQVSPEPPGGGAPGSFEAGAKATAPVAAPRDAGGRGTVSLVTRRPGAEGTPPPAGMRRGAVGLGLLAVVGVVGGLLWAPAVGPTTRATPAPSPGAEPAPDLGDPLAAVAAQTRALAAAEARVWELQGVASELQIPDRVVRLTYHTTERMKVDGNLWKTHPVFSAEFLEVWEEFQRGLLAWLQALRSPAPGVERDARVLAHPEVRRILHRAVLRTYLYVLENARFENMSWAYQVIVDAKTSGNLEVVTQIPVQRALVERFARELRAFLAEAVSVWPGPPVALQLAEDLFRILGPHAARELALRAAEGRSPEELRKLVDVLAGRFEAAAPSEQGYVTGKALLYLLNVMVHDAPRALPWQERSRVLGRIEARLLEAPAWQEREAREYRVGLLARCLYEEARLHRLWDENAGPIPLERGRAERVLEAVRPGLETRIGLRKELGDVAESLLSNAGGPFYVGREDPRSAREWQELYQGWKKGKP